MTIIVLSGEIATGKSTLAKGLETEGFKYISTSQHLTSCLKKRGIAEPTRQDKQEMGDELDQDPAWIAYLTGQAQLEVVDAVRRIDQVTHLRETRRNRNIIHVHLESDPDDLIVRYANRGEVDYKKVKTHGTESSVPSLRGFADLVINTSRCTKKDTLLRVLAHVGIKIPEGEFPTKLVDILVGGQYGSEGKGHVVSHLAPEYDILLRVGGPNAGHTIRHPDTNEPVSFYHLPSGSLHAPSADLVLGPGAVINPDVLQKEAKHLGGLDSLEGRLFIDPQAMIITTDDVEKEGGLVGRVGSTGQGVGFATARKIQHRGRGDLLAGDVPELRKFIKPTLEILETAYAKGFKVFLEGTQGTGLSLHHGHYPYVTSRDTTASGTAGEAGVPPHRINQIFMVIRTNPIRVQSPQGGTSGPMGIETSWEEVSKRAGVPANELRQKEMTTTTKRQRRVAEFNWSDLRRAVLLNSPTSLVLTFTDYISIENQSANKYEDLTEETRKFIEEIENFTDTPVSLITTRFESDGIIGRW